MNVHDSSYYKSLDRHTRYNSSYEDFDARVFLATTWQSEDFRKARVEATATILALSDEARSDRLEAEKAEGTEYVDFFVSMYTKRFDWNDLASPTSIWRVELLRPQATAVEPISIERISRPDATLLALYPYINRFGESYRLRFPAVDEAGLPTIDPDGARVTLRFASAVGRLEPTWELPIR